MTPSSGNGISEINSNSNSRRFASGQLALQMCAVSSSITQNRREWLSEMKIK